MVWDMIGVIDAVFNGYFFLTSTITNHSIGIQYKYRAEKNEYTNHIYIYNITYIIRSVNYPTCAVIFAPKYKKQ